jgi:hypothetical protein
MLFDWFVTGQVLDMNPDHACSTMLTVEEAGELLECIKIVKKTADDKDTETKESDEVLHDLSNQFFACFSFSFPAIFRLGYQCP